MNDSRLNPPREKLLFPANPWLVAGWERWHSALLSPPAPSHGSQVGEAGRLSQCPCLFCCHFAFTKGQREGTSNLAPIFHPGLDLLVFSFCWWPIMSHGVTGMGSWVGYILCGFFLRGLFHSGRRGSWPHLQGCVPLKEVLHIRSVPRSDKAPRPARGSPNRCTSELLQGPLGSRLAEARGTVPGVCRARLPSPLWGVCLSLEICLNSSSPGWVNFLFPLGFTVWWSSPFHTGLESNRVCVLD